MARQKTFNKEIDDVLSTFISKPNEELKDEKKTYRLKTKQELIKEQEVKSEPQMAKAIIRENKTRRVQLLMKPSLHETTKQKAQSLGLSFNDYVSMVLEEANNKE